MPGCLILLDHRIIQQLQDKAQSLFLQELLGQTVLQNSVYLEGTIMLDIYRHLMPQKVIRYTERLKRFKWQHILSFTGKELNRGEHFDFRLSS